MGHLCCFYCRLYGMNGALSFYKAGLLCVDYALLDHQGLTTVRLPCLREQKISPVAVFFSFHISCHPVYSAIYNKQILVRLLKNL